MRSFIRGVAAATIITSAATFAFAAEHAEGVVKDYNAGKQMLTLNDGKSFTLPQSFKEAGLKSGAKVDIAYDVKDGKNMATTVKIVK